jgi:hypothetical protein
MARDVNASVDTLFEEFVTTWTGGDSIDINELLERSGPDKDVLAALVDAFLARAPRRPPSEESKQAVSALAARLNESEPPLLSARVAARKKLADVAAAIVSACGLPVEAEGLVRDYYQRLEVGLLDPAGVSRSVWAVLERVVAPAARKLAVQGYPYRTAHSRPMVSFQRLADSAGAVSPAVQAAEPSRSSELEHEVAALFAGTELD